VFILTSYVILGGSDNQNGIESPWSEGWSRRGKQIKSSLSRQDGDGLSGNNFY
jgi:hypothetical protein